MITLEESYRSCRQIARQSGSNFYRSFSLLHGDRRRGMDALYAFARLADDVSDSSPTPKNDTKGNRFDDWNEWVDSLAWHAVAVPDNLPDRVLPDGVRRESHRRIEILEPIRLALADSVQRFSIPLQSLKDLVAGVAQDQSATIRFQTWDELYVYCQRVASTVGIACLSIWNPDPNTPVGSSALQAANDCGIAFQLTNILRDLLEDSRRGRCYLPAQEAARFGLAPGWVEKCCENDHATLSKAKLFVGTILERASGHYESGWAVKDHACPEGKRMFSLMWSTYRQLLKKIESDIGSVFKGRVGLGPAEKLKAVANHFITPLYRRHERSVSTQNRSCPLPLGGVVRRPSDVRVAVVGGGLAGCNAAMHLARHGVRVDLYEAKMRLGGRVGSFIDPDSDVAIDYCQHVGMKCCKELLRWIDLTNQKSAWAVQSQLHFVSKTGKKVCIRALPFPAPFHLGHLILRWPDLGWWDRFCISRVLWKLVRMPHDDAAKEEIAETWLKKNHQSKNALKHFWETILVSALGERVDRVSVGAARKVLVDGFAATRDAFHLLVPQKPLSDLVDGCMQQSLASLGVRVRLRTAVDTIHRLDHDRIRLAVRNEDLEDYDFAIIAVPWYRYQSLVANSLSPNGQSNTEVAHAMDSSPITGVHTWWDTAWLQEPHAIVIDRLSQWVFPGPSQARVQDSAKGSEVYYQVVISASRDLPKGQPDAVLESVRRELCELFPSASNAKLLRGKVVTDPNAVFTVSPESQTSRLDSDHWIDNRLLLAGDWTNTGWPATMEGALRSGVLASERLLWAIGFPTRIRMEND